MDQSKKGQFFNFFVYKIFSNCENHKIEMPQNSNLLNSTIQTLVPLSLGGHKACLVGVHYIPCTSVHMHVQGISTGHY